MIGTYRNTRHAVIARLDRAIQYAAAFVIHTTTGAYWIPLRGA